ncbi:MAG TPA: DNA mismatch repair endonuclease MutL [Anaerolineaceae bacterium]|nr:DNA mismatch repair endonuclease MutL [Anaerolineaceae bacterium]
MNNIHILSDDIASQIAAGEVIERPSSVVKELVENSIDAGSTHIVIRISEAGKKLIEVTDNGDGIPFDELELAIMRHATSKLQTASDLFSINTLGFRGEALASIASVSHFSMISKINSEKTGGKIENVEGESYKKSKIGVPDGTSVSVRNLFYNVPARLKFLKSDLTEKQKISNLVSKFALSYPKIRFDLFNENQLLIQTNGNGDRREILNNIFGLEIAKQMLEVKFEEAPYKIIGFISPIGITRSNRKEMTFFVNGRWIQDIALSSAIMKSYHTMIMVGRYPICLLFLDLPSDFVDVNVHPTKAEVRFSKPDLVYSMVQRATRRALLAYSSFPEISHKFWNQTENRETNEQTSWNPATLLTDNPLQEPSNAEQSSLSPESNNQNEIKHKPFMPLLRHIGQIGATYIVAEGPDGLYLIDQHAAHERILFEKLMDSPNGPIASQPLLSPEIVQLPAHQSLILKEKIEVLKNLGFDITEFGPNTYQVRSIPALLIGINPSEVIRVVVEDFEDDEKPLGNVTEAIIAARICKRAAVKGGQVLSKEEQKALIENLEKCKTPRTCPHGRPTMIHLSVDLLEKQFGRKGSI